MKTIISFLLFTALCGYLSISCNSSRNSKSDGIKLDSSSQFTMRAACKVYKIDSINDYYVVYVIKDSARYKVISKKSAPSGLNTITPGKIYELQLTCVFGAIARGVYKPTCLDVDSKTEVCLEDSIVDICYGENLKGLCVENN